MRLSVNVLAGMSALLLVGQSGGIAQTPKMIEGELTAEESYLMDGDGSYYNMHEFVGYAGEQVTITMESEEVDAYVILLHPQGNKLAEDDDSGGGTNAQLAVTLPVDGTYVVVANTARTRETGTYQLHWQVTGETAVNRSVESEAEANRLLQLGIQQYQMSQFREAQQSWEHALVLYRELGDRQGEANSLGNLSQAYYSLGQFQQAIDFLQQNLAIARKIGDRHGEANSLNNLGLAYYSLGQLQRAIALYEQSLEIAQEIGDRQGEANSLGNLGSVYYSLGQYQQTISFFQKSLDIAQEVGDRWTEVTILGNLGNVYSSLGQYDRTIMLHEQSLAIRREIGDRQGEAHSLDSLGNTYNFLGQYDQALKLHEQSLAIRREIGDRQGEAHSLSSLGNVYNALGQYDQSILFLKESLEISQEIGDRNAEANALGILGIAHHVLGQYNQALEVFQESLEIRQEIGNRQGEASALGNLGNVYYSLGQYQQAITFHEKSLNILQEIGDRQGAASSLNNLGLTYEALDQYERAIDFFQQALNIAREIGDLRLEASSLGNLGLTYDSLGQYQLAIMFYEEHRDIAQEIGDRQGETIALNNLGNTYNTLGHYQQAQDSLQESLKITREIGNRQGEAHSLGNLGGVYYYLGQYEQAITFHTQALAIAQEMDNRQGEAIHLNNLGLAYEALGHRKRAITFLQKSLDIKQEIGDKAGAAGSFNNLGFTLFNLNNYPEAEQKLLAAANIWEAIRIDIRNNNINKISIFDQQSRTYRLLQEVQITQSKTIQALETAERGRTRAFIELFASRLNAGDSNFQVNSPNHAAIQQIAKEQNTTLVEYSIIYDEFDLDENPGKEATRESILYIWVIAPTGQVTFRQVDLTPLWRDQNTNLGQLVQITRKSIGVRGTRTDASPELKPDVIASRQAEADQKLRQLHQLLIDPIADLLPTDPEAKVVFVPQGSLFSVPFPALKDAEGNYLIEKHTILTAPSIQTLQFTREAKTQNNSNSDNTLLVGNPTMPIVTFLTEEGFEDEPLTSLPGAQQEAEAIGDFLEASALIGSSATETTVKQQIETANIIHFATHGLLEYGDPQQTGSRDVPGAIALTPSDGEDGLLTSSEILDMNLSADLVVLSACDTGRGRITGDGVIGLSRSFISAGVPSIIVSLWQVPDAPTAELMTEFYRQREQTGDNAQALRRAMLTTLQTHPDPKNWAAFTLIGESD